MCRGGGGGPIPIFLTKPIATCDLPGGGSEVPVPIPSGVAHAVQIQIIKQQPTDESLKLHTLEL